VSDDHPVQFESVWTEDLCACLVCGVLVHSSDKWREVHRKNHDALNKLLDKIMNDSRSDSRHATYGRNGQ
jgi:hypothetical protein